MRTNPLPPRSLAAIGIVALFVTTAFAGDTKPGLLVRLYDIDGHMSLIPELRPGQLPNAVKVVGTLELLSKRGDFAPAESGFYTEIVGDLTIAQPGVYVFRLICDDGGVLWIDDRLVVNNDGLHAAIPKDGEVELAAGKHKLRVAHFDAGGDKHLELRWRPPASVAKTPDSGADSAGFTLIPPAALSHGKSVSRETSPGKKQIIPPLRRGLPGDGSPVAGMHPSYPYHDRIEKIDTELTATLNTIGRCGENPPAGENFITMWLPPGATAPIRIHAYYFPPYRPLHLIATKDRIYRASIESFMQPGLWIQGCVFYFADGQPSDIDRLRISQTDTFEMLAVGALRNGVEIRFTKPLDPRCGWDPESYYVEQWPFHLKSEISDLKSQISNLKSHTSDSEREAQASDQSEPDAPARAQPPRRDGVRYPVKSASVSADRRRVFLEIDDLKTSHVVYIRLLPPCYSEDGERPWSTEAWYTLNMLPPEAHGTVLTPPAGEPQNILTDEEKAAGWKLLFDGETTAGWRGYRKNAFPTQAWKIIDTPTDGACLVRVGGGGDICTIDEFDNFELELEWRISAAGNSGIFYRVDESVGWPWESGPEMQVLDNAEHADGRNPKTSAGSNYALYAPTRDATAPVGFFNKVRIVVNGPHVEHWLNGEKVVEYELWTDDWRRRVADSKFKAWPKYGMAKRGRIVLQDHGDRVWYRNIKIRPLSE